MSNNENLNGEQRCSFCGKFASQVERMFTGPRVAICTDCIRFCNEMLAEDQIAEKQAAGEDFEVQGLPKPQEIKAILDEYVIGQDEAKKSLSVAVY
ncbi:MAG: ATP-dependent Clp protease ATP-binding subunit ClpX, partial [Phascolarctobacterium sp.]|nr:ATP-dependent Clp protease ATP-binding subunit ClpX [Phascolarctobacterium sp.]